MWTGFTTDDDSLINFKYSLEKVLRIMLTHTIFSLLSEKQGKLSIDKKRLTEILKRLVKYKMIENKPSNEANSYCNISDDSQRTETPLALNFLDTPTLVKCPNKELEVTIVYDTENTIHKLNLQIQDISTELEAIKLFVNAQFYLT